MKSKALVTFILSLFATYLPAQDWKSHYKVGDKVELKINEAMWQKGIVSENPPEGMLRVKCEEYIDPSSSYRRAGGVYMVYSKVDIRPLQNQVYQNNTQFKRGDKIEAFDAGKWHNATILENKGTGYLVHWDGYSSTYDAIVSAVNVRNKTGVATNEESGGSPKMSGNLPLLSGTHWAIKSMTKKGQAVKDYGVLPTIDFCKSGTWTLGRYAGTNEGGKYQISGSRIIFKYEDGSVWGDYTMNWNAATGILELTSGSYIIRMIYKSRLNNC
jgi:hypothetical protein